MLKKIVLGAVLGAVLMVVAISSSFALTKVSDGVFRLKSDQMDDLVGLENMPEVEVLLLEEKSPKAVSDSHIKLTRTWVEAGGVLWVTGDALESPIARGIAPFRVTRFDYKRTSTGNRGGELIVKDASPRLIIHDHALTDAVTQLYLFARYKFDGTQNAEPLVEMTDTQGNHGLVIEAIPVGKGFLVLDGTARKARMLFGRLPGFDPARPNSLEQDGTWSSYDWDRMTANALAYAQSQD